MPRAPRVTGQELLAAMKSLGWRVVAQRGSHVQLTHDVRNGRVTIPLHAGVIVGPGLLSAILRQAGITVDELREVL